MGGKDYMVALLDVEVRPGGLYPTGRLAADVRGANYSHSQVSEAPPAWGFADLAVAYGN